ncbi:MAG: sulfite exporter TauE/SafE family protein [Actinobacteria bacterium]|nr:sulfite exporter TauE/SafE family protein [Actinomycetota bacterium]MCB9413532.1 sulfite exporter TauE/SafE family protein [Actinomycetota bacterium]
MDLAHVVIELAAGFAAGVFAGITGAGGGILLVPILVWLGLPPLASTATSNVAISLTALSGTVTNTRKFDLPWRRVLLLAIPAVVCAPLGVMLAERLPTVMLLWAFAAFNLISVGLLQLRLASSSAPVAGSDAGEALPAVPATPAVATGGAGGLLAGLFGVGGGLIMVPMQTLALSTPVRLASRISLAVVLFASISAVVSHAVTHGDVRWLTGVIMAVGGFLGAPLGARWLHRLSDLQSTRIIQVTLAIVAVSFGWRALAG